MILYNSQLQLASNSMFGAKPGHNLANVWNETISRPGSHNPSSPSHWLLRSIRRFLSQRTTCIQRHIWFRGIETSRLCLLLTLTSLRRLFPPAVCASRRSRPLMVQKPQMGNDVDQIVSPRLRKKKKRLKTRVLQGLPTSCRKIGLIQNKSGWMYSRNSPLCGDCPF